ncbi:MAG: hypothetical protein AAGA54_30255 [Myxococcota bacterium]
MRTLRWMIVAAFTLAGCHAAPPTPPELTPRQQHVVRAQYQWARTLQHVVMTRPTDALLDASGQKLVLELARAQTCVASTARDVALAEETQVLLDAYLELHDEHGQVPSLALRRKIGRAQRDAAATEAGVASPYHLGCAPFRRPASKTQRSEYIHRDNGGAGPYIMQGRSVPGGVVN